MTEITPSSNMNFTDEEEEFFWRYAANLGTPLYQLFHCVDTDWKPADLLAKYPMKVLYTDESVSDGLLVVVGTQAGTLLKIEDRRGALSIALAGSLQGELHRHMTAILELIPAREPEPEPEQDTTLMTYLYSDGAGRANATCRYIQAPTWEQIRGNYAAGVQPELDTLMAASPGDLAGRIGILHGPPGTGKEQPVSEPVLTPEGWRPIGEIRPGDLVIGSQGKPVTVLSVFPQGIKPVYTVKFNDGAEVRAGYDHLWQVSQRTGGGARKDIVVSTGDMLRSPLTSDGGRRVFRVPLGAPVHMTASPLPLDPYLLGLLLGNGNFTRKYDIGFTSADEQLQDSVRKLLPSGTSLRESVTRGNEFRITTGPCESCGSRAVINPIAAALKDLEIWGCRATTKFIPEPYTGGSPEDRLALLQGLLDTDGTCDMHGSIEYGTSSAQLAYDVAALVRSLGGTATIKIRRDPIYTYRGKRLHGAVAYRVRICLPEGLEPFRLLRKAERYTSRTTYPKGRFVVAIRKEDYEEESVCILVDAPDHLYVTTDYVLTHNTFALRALARAWAGKADFHYLIDPDKFFSIPSYMTSVLLNGDASWRVIICEDADEFIAPEAKADVGQALSRLLNLTDGMLGQGLQILLLFTSNVRSQKLSNAIIRPGRCFLSHHVTPFLDQEAASWLAARGVTHTPRRSMTLAEMYEVLGRKS